MESTIIKAKIFGKDEEVFIAVPSYLYENALYEKKKAGSLDYWIFNIDRGKAPEYIALRNFIEKKVGRRVDDDFERIKIIS